MRSTGEDEKEKGDFVELRRRNRHRGSELDQGDDKIERDCA